ncbi:MAG: hypothetical protein ACP5OU_04545 [Methanothrix sp.]
MFMLMGRCIGSTAGSMKFGRILLASVSRADPMVDLAAALSGIASCMGGVGRGFWHHHIRLVAKFAQPAS